MSRYQQFSASNKQEERNLLAPCCKRRADPKSIHPTIQSSQSHRQCVAPTRGKSYGPRSSERRGKIIRKKERIDAMSTDSTNSSEKGKMDSLLQLRKEINDWKRQEALRSRVNEMLGKAGVGNDYSDIDERAVRSADTPKSFLVESAEERTGRTVETTDDNQDIESAKYFKMKSKEQRKENIPLVTWIPLQPETSARTSLKSVADYMSEVQDDVPMPKRRLCPSPETLNALENAEKLVEDTEKQISQMTYEAMVNDDIGLDIFDTKVMEDERIYVRNVVASTFQKGYYDPGPSTILNKENLKSPFTLTNLAKPSGKLYKSSKILETPPAPIDDCLLCKTRKIEPTKDIIDKNKALRPTSKAKVIEIEPKIGPEPAEKLHVQKGPIISIKGDFAIQTSKIIDIQPDDTSTRQLGKDPPENIATYEFRYGSRTKEKSVSFDDIPEKDSPSSSANEKTSQPIPKQVESKPRFEQPASLENSIVNRQPVTSRTRIPTSFELDKKTKLWKEIEDVELDYKDLSLNEPVILLEVDSLLDQQRRIIRQVHKATERFDDFLTKRLPDDVSGSSEGTRDDRHRKERKIGKNNASSGKRDRNLIGKSRMTVDALNEMDNVVDRNKALGNRSHRSTSLSSGKLVATKSLSLLQDKQSNGNTPGNSLISGESGRVREDSPLSRKEMIIESSKDAEYSESFEHASFVDKSLSETDVSNPQQSEARVQKKKTESSSNNSSIVQASAHNETKSNAGFIENLKNTHIFKENNLDANVYRKHEKTVDKILKSVENIMINENSKGDEKHSLYEVEKDTRITGTLDEKENTGNRNFAIEIQGSENDVFENRSAKEAVHDENEEKYVSEGNPDKNEDRKDESTTKFQDHQETSLKTSHLIESISDISFPNAIESSDDSLRLSTISNNKSDVASKKSEATANESSAEKSTESKIESKLLEARDNLNTLMKTMNENSQHNISEPESLKCNDSDSSKKTMNGNSYHNVAEPESLKFNDSDSSKKTMNGNSYQNVAEPEGRSNHKVQERITESYISTELPEKLKNVLVHKDTVSNDKEKPEVAILDSTDLTYQEHNLSNTRSLVTMLEENGNAVLESFQQHKLILLKKLESCSIPSNYQNKRLFTSTVLGDTDPPNGFTRLKTSSESSLDTHSEGEVCFSSSASYSLGEVRRKIESSRSSSNAKGSSSNSTNNTSLPRSIGEIYNK